MKKLFINHWPIVFIIGLWFLFASPYFVKGLVPFPSDYLVNNFAPWNAYPEFAGPVKNAATPDVITQIFPWKSLVIEAWKAGAVPLWNPYVFSGTPLLANYQSAALSPINFLYFVFSFIDAWSIQILLQPLLAGIFMFLFVRTIGISKEGSTLSAIAFMFCGFITGWMVYGTLGYAILFLPLALLAVEKYFQTNKWYYLSLLSLTIPLSFYSGHFQTSLYFLLFIFAYSSFKFWQTKNLRSFILSLAYTVLGLFLTSPQIIPSMEFYNEAVRSSTFLKTEIIPWSYLPTLLAPDYFGNSVTRNDWFGHYAEWNGYIGLIPLMLGFYALKNRTKEVLFFFVVAVFVLFLAFETPVQELLYTLKVPVLSTSAASRIIVLFSFSASILAGFGLMTLIKDIRERKTKEIVIWFISFGILLAFMWGLTLSYQFFPTGKELIARSNLKLPSILFALLNSIILLIYFLNKSKFINAILILPIFLIIISAFDLFRFTTKWMTFQKRDLVYPKVEITKYFSEFESPYRTYGNFSGEAAMTYRLQTVEGYDPLYIQRYGEFLEYANSGRLITPPRSGVNLEKKGDYASSAIDLLGIKYFLQKQADSGMEWTFPIWKYPVNRFTDFNKDTFYTIYLNHGALPRAILVSNVKVEKGNKNILKTVFGENTKLNETVVLEENPSLKLSNAQNSSVVFKDYKPNNVLLHSKSNTNQMLVLSDPYYPGWKAYIDNKQAKIFRANYAFRAIEVPKGEHEIRFTYEPNSFKIGLGVGIFGLIGIGLLGMLGYKKKI